ncbi:MAG: hypothetical protein JW803_00330 [Endomicrobiales bacterium]|nr:hypothetical protein [Endomicrobiales bacterium]
MSKKILTMMFVIAAVVISGVGLSFAEDENIPDALKPQDAEKSDTTYKSPFEKSENEPKINPKSNASPAVSQRKLTPSYPYSRGRTRSTVDSKKKTKIESTGSSKTTRRRRVKPMKTEAPAKVKRGRSGLFSRVMGGGTKPDKLYIEANEAYVRGRMQEAAAAVDELLKADPQNAKAMSLKNKITYVDSRMGVARRDVAERLYYRAESFYRQDNMLDALLYVKRSLKLDPQSEKAKTLLNSVMVERSTLLNSLKGADRNRVNAAIEDFSNENFSAAAKTFRELQPYYAWLDNFLAIATYHEVDKSDRKRSMKLLNVAVGNIKMERYRKAQEQLMLALEADRTNAEASALMELVNYEMSMPVIP